MYNKGTTTNILGNKFVTLILVIFNKFSPIATISNSPTPVISINSVSNKASSINASILLANNVIIPIAAYQGIITLLASKIEAFIPDALFYTVLIEITSIE